jgi:hypothetical protein
MFEREHRNSEFDFYELNNHWAIGLNFCSPLLKSLSALNEDIGRILKRNTQCSFVISGKTVRQLL